MIKDINDKQKRILDFLKSEKRASTSKIAGYIGISTEYAIRYLEELVTKGILKKEEETIATYWVLMEIGGSNERASTNK